MIESNFIYFATLNTFNEQKENIKDESIAFIAETQQIYNRGVLYGNGNIVYVDISAFINNYGSIEEFTADTTVFQPIVDKLNDEN